MKEAKNIKKNMWAYFSPYDGHMQTRSLSDTKNDAREAIAKFENLSWRDYEREGFKLHKVEADIKVLPYKNRRETE